ADQTQASHGCFEQFKQLLLLLLKLKAWRLAAICVPIALAASALYVMPMIAKTLQRGGFGTSRDGSDHLLFYGGSDLAASKAKVLVDRSSFPAEAAAATNIVKNEGGNSNWIEECASETDCRERLMFNENDDAIVALIRYSKTPDKSRKMQIYELFDKRSNNSSKVERYDNKNTKSWPNSACANWIKTGLFQQIASQSVPVSVSLSAIGLNFYLLISTVSCIRMIKSNGFLQQLFRSGLSVSAYWLVIWIVTVLECLFFRGPSNALKCSGVFPASVMARLFIFFTLFCLNLAAFMLLMELLLPPQMLVSIVTIVMSIGILVASFNGTILKKYAKFLLYIFSPLFASEYIIKLFNSEVRRQFSVAELKNEDDSERLSQILTWTAIGLLLFALLLTYLDFILSSGNGLVYHRTTRSCPTSGHKDRSDSAPSEGPEEKLESHIEPVMELPPIIAVKAVTKTYRNCCLCCQDATAVLKNLSCTIYRGQITALIGHNGAGKSTLIKVLTGEELPDEGTAHIGGCLVTNPLIRLSLRGRIGTCPQFDALCDSLTVMECIRVTLISKAASDTSHLERARGMLQRLGLGDKEDVLSCNLSGGQKRKVSTILALMGDPDVVFLDEPTSGLDPVSRRQLWQLLQEEKSARSIILCTQFMDEADILADRKIFLCGGKIVCVGSSMFLKRAFGCSFTLNVSLKSKSGAESLLAKLKQVRLKSQDDTELQLEVPALNSDVLIKAVQVLETSKEVETFGLSQASLDDIFMRLGGMDSDEVIKAFRAGTLKLPPLSESTNVAVATAETKESLDEGLKSSKQLRTSIFVQFCALFATNLKRQVRVRSNLVSRFLVPATLFALMVASAFTLKGPKEKRTTDPKDHRMDILIRPAAPRIDSNGLNEIRIACVSDGKANSISKKDCKSLVIPYESKAMAPPPIVITKSPSQSIKDFMSQRSTRDQLYNHQKDMKTGRIPTYAVFYASPWLKNASNKDRRALVELLAYFGMAGSKNTTAVALLEPASSTTVVKTGLQLPVFYLVFSMLSVSYLSDPIEDMSSRVRSYLIATGMTHLAYWVNTFLMHWVQYAICYVIAVGLLMISDTFRGTYLVLAAFLPVFLLGTVSNLLTIYTIAVLTKTKNTLVSTGCILAAVFLPVAMMLINSYSVIMKVLIWTVPPAAPLGLVVSCAHFYFLKLAYYQIKDGSELPGMIESLWTNSGIFHSLIAMPVHIIILLGIICAVEKSAAIKEAVCHRGAQTKPGQLDSDMEDGAKKEAERVLAAPRSSNNVLEVRQLQKIYPNRVHAVRGVTFGAMGGEIFGLLGVNGAGKSTSMSVIVGEEAATEGVCEVRVQDGAWLSGREGSTIGAIGYCPQHSPLFSSITVAEHIRFYADIRGLDSIEAEQQTTRLMQSLGLSQHSDKQAGQLSGGNKRRRLCLAIALLGDPALIVIDEASTGVDPENKRFIWGAIRRMVHKQRSVMVTTHSMEEVGALCSRVGIMNKGRMISVGTVQNLLSRHGDAYTLELLLDPETGSEIKQKRLVIKNSVSEQFKGAQTQDDLGLGLVMQFSVPKSSVRRLSDALRWLAANQSRLKVSYWALYQMSLDQVFVKLVKTYDHSGQTLGANTGSTA
uniref:ABC transporter domain-containing protein n=1 Tax=Macrostomum lignano TaxID=282301 RepID=A0A1I8G5Y6_9PLAT